MLLSDWKQVVQLLGVVCYSKMKRKLLTFLEVLQPSLRKLAALVCLGSDFPMFGLNIPFVFTLWTRIVLFRIRWWQVNVMIQISEGDITHEGVMLFSDSAGVLSINRAQQLIFDRVIVKGLAFLLRRYNFTMLCRHHCHNHRFKHLHIWRVVCQPPTGNTVPNFDLSCSRHLLVLYLVNQSLT